MTTGVIVILLVIAVLGHAMALLWHVAGKRQWPIVRRMIYTIEVKDAQIRRELKNSIHTPLHAVLLAACVWFGFFDDRTVTGFFLTLLATTVWAEIWHYASHRAMHWQPLHWIHAEHHKSMLCSPFTAISFSFTEKLLFDLGMLAPFLTADLFLPVNFYGVAGWFVGYLIINSFSHANFEFRGGRYNEHVGQVLATTTYHALHHSRYINHFGLGTRFLDRSLDTEWPDYEPLYLHVVRDRRPLEKLREEVETGP